jgi:hypothetical protein
MAPFVHVWGAYPTGHPLSGQPGDGYRSRFGYVSPAGYLSNRGTIESPGASLEVDERSASTRVAEVRPAMAVGTDDRPVETDAIS